MKQQIRLFVERRYWVHEGRAHRRAMKRQGLWQHKHMTVDSHRQED